MLLNEYGEKNNLKVSDDEVRNEIQKQVKGMLGRKKWFLIIIRSIRRISKGSLYEEKIIDLIKSKINLTSKEVNTKEAEKIIAEFNKPNVDVRNLKPHLLQRETN